MEYLVEFKSFIKKFKDAIKAEKAIKIDIKNISSEIKNLLLFVDDEPNIDVIIDNYRNSMYTDRNINNKNSKIIYMNDEKDFISILIKNTGPELSFNINIVKNDILSMIEYITKKYNFYKLFIIINEPKKKVKANNYWIYKNTKSYPINLQDLENMDINIDAIKIEIILN